MYLHCKLNMKLLHFTTDTPTHMFLTADPASRDVWPSLFGLGLVIMGTPELQNRVSPW
jgi:hypothetical protein